jgi:hypothetical protein
MENTETMNRNLQVYFEARGDVDLREALRGRGDVLEAGLSIIDTELPIPNAGIIDWIALDSQRNLVIADVEGAAPDDVFTRIVAHAQWFASNSAIVRRMYQVWNVSWDAPIRALCVFRAEHRTELEKRGFNPKIEGGGIVIEMVVGQLVRARDGREAIILSTFGASSAAAQRSLAAPEPRREADSKMPAPRERESPAIVSQPAERVFTRNTTRGGNPGNNSRTMMHAGQERVLSREEAYRRELGLTHEEFAEFFEGPSTP